MGRSFDIARRSRPAVAPTPPAAKKRRSSNSSFSLSSLIFLAIVCAIGTYYALNRGNVSSNNPTTSTTTTVATQSTPNASSLETQGPNPTRSTSSPSPTSTPQPSQTTTPTPSASPTSTPSPTVARIAVYNGSGTAGAGAKVTDQLTAAGYTISKTTTAKNHYASSVIYYQKDSQQVAQALENELDTYTIKLQESTAIAPDDIWVVIGDK